MKIFLCLCAGLVLLHAPAADAIEYPLSISTDGRTLLQADGSPLFLNAATPWHINARLDQSEAIAYLDQRQAQGFNALLIMLMVPDYYSGSVLNAYGEAPFTTTGNFGTPNEAYFAQCDWVLEQARLRGMVVLLTHTYVGYGCGPEGWCAEMKSQGLSAMRAWGRWLGQRYWDQPNIIWVNGGDVDADAFGAGAHVDAIAEGILQFDDQHLHTAHCSRLLSGNDCYDRPWLDIDSSYGDCIQSNAEVFDVHQNQPTRPNFYIEGRYEGAPLATMNCLRWQAWSALLGGATGHAYGHETVWDFLNGWPGELDTEDTDAMSVLGSFAEFRDWKQLVPDFAHQVLVAGYGNMFDDNYVPAARMQDGSSIVAYLRNSTSVSIDLSALSGTTAEIWWVDPVDGGATLDAVMPSTGVQSFSPPAGNDWILVIDDASLALNNFWEQSTPAPGAPRAGLAVSELSPNPFNPRTTIRFTARAGESVRIDVMDVRGRHLEQIFEGEATGVEQTVVWDARSFASGIFYVRVSTESGAYQVQRGVLVR